MRREHERLVARDGEDDETAAAVAGGVVGLIEVADEEFALLSAIWVRTNQLNDPHEAMVARPPDRPPLFARQLA